jgi:hypothetical protein
LIRLRNNYRIPHQTPKTVWSRLTPGRFFDLLQRRTIEVLTGRQAKQEGRKVETLKALMSLCVLVAGFLNAGAIGHQALKLRRAMKVEGHSLPMYFIFLFIQSTFVANGIAHADWWQASGMIASMVTTIWTIVLIYKFHNSTPQL